MNGGVGVPHRSSSPLKRRASTMDPAPEVDITKGDAPEGHTKEILPREMSIDPPHTSASSHGNGKADKAPPIYEQIKIIETLLKASKEAQLKEGDKVYLVSRSWLDKAIASGCDSKESKKDAGEPEPLGPIDNTDIIKEYIKDSSGQEFTRLNPGSGLESFEAFPEDAWNMMVDWYGIRENQRAIIRTAINDAPDASSEANISYEFHPPVFKIHRLWSQVSTLPIEQALKAKNPPPLVLVRSRKAHAHTFLKDLKNLAGVPLERKIRLWFIPQQLPAGDGLSNGSALTPPDSPVRENESNLQDPWSHLLLDVSPFLQLDKTQRVVAPVVDSTTNDNYNGKSAIQLWDLVTDQTLILDEAIGNLYVSTFPEQRLGKLNAKTNGLALASTASSGRNSPDPRGGFTRKGLRNRPNRSFGAVGLTNLGNTCYMNSALQCVRSVEELTKYFLTNSHSDELNKSNPLGYNGRVALAYGSLLKEIYQEESRGSVTPRAFKQTVGHCRSTFQGWAQQDSQEFIGFLLDGLQEDLSRIKKKPYIEKPDSTDDMINNPEAIRKMAKEVWDITRKRDDSVIADLFTGMYKSTLKCPVCAKISITFDPFNNLTLPLPVEDLMARTVKFFPLNERPVMIEVELKKHSTFQALKQFIADRTGVPVERLMGAEEYKGTFFKIYDNDQVISQEITGKDVASIHELEAAPTNWPDKGKSKKIRSMLDIATPPDAKEWDDPMYESMVVPVFHRIANQSDIEGVSPPHFIVLTREEASNRDQIERKVLEKLATFSTWSPLTAEESDNANGVESSPVVIPSDADLSGDSKMTARSVEGEEDMVDVTMKDPSEKLAGPNLQSHILKAFDKKRPAFIYSHNFLNPLLQNLFTLCYFKDGDDLSVPTGWQQSNRRDLPNLSEREVHVGHASPSENWSSTNSGNEDSSNDEGSNTTPCQTRMTHESSEEDENSIPSVQNSAPPQKGDKKRHKTKAKPGTKRWQREMKRDKETQRAAASAKSRVKPQQKPRTMAPAVADGGPLIRLGEGLVVDWYRDSWELVFGQPPFNSNDTAGFKTFENLETLNDPILKITQRRRLNRRSRGITLDECLDEFERAETLSEEDMWYCPRCKEHRRASKKFDLWKTPDILVAHLKRFSNSGYRREKLDVVVDFPIEGLDLTSRVIEKEDGRDEIYDLIAVDDHYGGLGGGHYTAYAKNFMDERWYNFNDSAVSAVEDPSVVVTNAAYLLFYRRRSQGSLGGPRFAEIFHKFDNTGSAPGDQSECRAQNHGLKSTALRPKSDEDEQSYYSLGGGGGTPLLPSVEDEGVEMDDDYQTVGPNPLAQGWSFNAAREDSVGASFASDEVQLDSTDDERGQAQGASDQDIDMLSTTADNTDMDEPPAWGPKAVLSVPTKTGSDGGSDVVAEIHVDGEKGSQPN